MASFSANEANFFYHAKDNYCFDSEPKSHSCREFQLQLNEKIIVINQSLDTQRNLNRVRLTELKQGDEAIICAFEENGRNLLRLRDMGMLTGTSLRLIRFALLGDPIEIKARGYYLSIRKSAADLIWVVKK